MIAVGVGRLSRGLPYGKVKLLMVAVRAVESDVRSATLAAATRLFAAHGFEGTALQDVADAVGVSKPAVLHHFPSKEHIRQAVLDGILAHWNKTLPRLLLAATASRDRFDGVFGELHRFFASDPDRARLMMREALDRPAELRKLLRDHVRPWLSAVAQYVRLGRELGRHYPDVDDDAYVLHVIQLVVVGTACASVTSAVLETEPRLRYDRELARIARSSLFSPRSEKEREPRRKGPSPSGDPLPQPRARSRPPSARPRGSR